MGDFWLAGEPYDALRWTGRRRAGYAAALVCVEGHLVHEGIMRRPDFGKLGFCLVQMPIGQYTHETCGARVIGRCLHCGLRFRGVPIKSDADVDLCNFRQPFDRVVPYELAFCERCGGSHPWATREQRVRQLENLVQAQRLGVEDNRQALAALEQLERPGASEEAELSLWRTVLKHAPGLKDSVGRIAESLLTAWIKQQLGLP